MVKYLEWLANVVPVLKKDGNVRVCVDFRNLNKASLKDDFPLPHINMLVDSIVGHSMLLFMDVFSRVMPFGLKNARATYQRVASTLFHDMMHKNVELLGHIVSERGIEVDPKKIKSILDMPTLRTEKEQTRGIWKTRDEKLKPYYAYLDLLIDRFDELRYIHLPRAENQFVDVLATLAFVIEIPEGMTM
ncbi:Transposon Ty3-G Gag-Pol polyprotein [Vitis vinifera]|uniref:Transposon Ty3-G Gag-Pol polyprotein n=1 Tax=Vitis vinifera TaxID=29760 RepID=A0A438GA97_VITVI|nr:Transposon Ty3-G Gag-Pol polyprotein [Vitis vinifera]